MLLSKQKLDIKKRTGQKKREGFWWLVLGRVLVVVGCWIDGLDAGLMLDVGLMHLSSLKLTAKAPKNGWLEYDPCLFSGASC